MRLHDCSFADKFTAVLGHRPHGIERLPFAKDDTRKEVYRRVNIAIAHIESNFRSRFNLEQVARSCCLSKFYLIKHFKAVVGLTPNAFHIQLRVACARRLLMSSSSSATAIALACGYRDLHALSKQFKKITGITPSQFGSGGNKARARALSEVDAKLKSPAGIFNH